MKTFFSLSALSALVRVHSIFFIRSNPLTPSLHKTPVWARPPH
jgi:hypothetical protein